MGQTKDGAKRALQTTRDRHGDEFFAERAGKGGSAGRNKGFAKSGKASEAGKLGAQRRWAKYRADNCPTCLGTGQLEDKYAGEIRSCPNPLHNNIVK